MWLENDKFRELGQAICKGEIKRLGGALFNIFHPENQYSSKMTVCPRCQKPLIGKMLPDLEYFVQACPDRHGAWMSPEVFGKVRDLISEQIFIASRRKKTMRVLRLAFLFGFGFVFLSNLSAMMKQAATAANPAQMQLQVQESFPAFDPEKSNFQDPAAKHYFSQLLPLTEAAASRRLLFEESFKTAKLSAVQSRGAFENYLKGQRGMISKLRFFYVPPELNAFHSKLITGIQNQILFYAQWTEEKALNPSADFGKMLSSPFLMASHQALLEAFGEIGKVYPDLDSDSSQAIEKRLCWLDVI